MVETGNGVRRFGSSYFSNANEKSLVNSRPCPKIGNWKDTLEFLPLTAMVERIIFLATLFSGSDTTGESSGKNDLSSLADNLSAKVLILNRLDRRETKN